MRQVFSDSHCRISYQFFRTNKSRARCALTNTKEWINSMEIPQVLPKREDQAPDVQDDPTLSRVLLSRVLIEEYEALAQPKSDDTRFSDLKNKSYCDGDIVKDIYQLIIRFNGNMSPKLARGMKPNTNTGLTTTLHDRRSLVRQCSRMFSEKSMNYKKKLPMS